MSLCELTCGLANMGSRRKKLNFPSSEAGFGCVVSSTRDEKPLHYTLKIQSFSLLKGAAAGGGNKSGRYESESFYVGGYQWKLALYPSGDKKRNGSDHISLYLVSAKDSMLGTTLEVNVMFTFLVYDHLKDKYLSIQDGKVRRFHALKTEWGFPKLLSLNMFNDASNGFLIDDCCVFGVDILVMNCDAKGESISLIKEPPKNKFTWNINNFSQLDKTLYEYSFEVGGYSWKIRLHPNGCSKAKTGFLSLYLILFNGSKQLPEGSRVYMDYEMTILNQLRVGGCKRTCTRWFDFGGVNYSWGHPNFISLSDLKKPAKGFIRKDTLIVEVKINVVSNLQKFV